MSNGRDRILEDISATNGTPFVSGIKGNSTPVEIFVELYVCPINTYFENTVDGFVVAKIHV